MSKESNAIAQRNLNAPAVDLIQTHLKVSDHLSSQFHPLIMCLLCLSLVYRQSSHQTLMRNSQLPLSKTIATLVLYVQISFAMLT